MDRINSSNMASLTPGARRGWQNQNLGTGIAGTVFDATYENGAQEELLALIEGAGLTPNASGWAQVLQGLLRRFGGNVTTLGASTTLTLDMAGLVLVYAGAGNLTLTLPPATVPGVSVGGVTTTLPLRYRLLRVDSDFNNTVTVQPSGTDVISSGGAAAAPLLLPLGGEWEVLSTGTTTWFAIFSSAQPRGCAFSATPGAFTWTCPPGVFWVDVEAWDAGAGGGYAASGSWGHGGGGGGYFRGVAGVIPGTVYTSTVGVGGVGGTSTIPDGASPATSTQVVLGGLAVLFSAGGATAAQGGSGNGGINGAGGSAPSVSGYAGNTCMAIGGAGGTTGTSVSPAYGGSGGASFGGSTSSAFLVGTTAASGLPGVGGNGGAGQPGAAGQNGAIFLRW